MTERQITSRLTFYLSRTSIIWHLVDGLLERPPRDVNQCEWDGKLFQGHLSESEFKTGVRFLSLDHTVQ